MRSSAASRAPAALLLASAIGAPVLLLAQAAPQPSRPSFRSEIEHVQVDVRVLDTNNEPVAGLTRDLFQTAIPLWVSAAAFRSGRDASVAIVVEGAAVEGASIELAVVALDGHGDTKARDSRRFEWVPASAAGTRVREQGFRWLPRLNLKPGRYQLRVAGAAKGPERGSVRLDIEVPSFSDGDLSMSGIVLSSVERFRTPTFKPDPLLVDDLPGPPTAVRSFAPGAIYFRDTASFRPTIGWSGVSVTGQDAKSFCCSGSITVMM